MTREEAIRWLTNEKWKNANNKYKKEWNEAFDTAIEALIEPRPKIAFACDGRKCGGDCSNCGRTTDIEHAINFNHIGDIYFEKLPGVGVFDTEHDHGDGEWIDITEGLTGGDSDK